MARQTKETTQTTTAAAAPAVASATPAAAPAAAPAAEKKPRAPKAKKEETVAAPAAEVTSAPSADAPVAEEVEGVKDSSRKRTAPTRESVLAEFDEVVASITEECARVKDSSDKGVKGTKFLTSLSKRVKNLQASTARAMKQKQPSTRKNNNSGFLKPVKLSADMAKFTNFDSKKEHSRVDVTKYICEYIRTHNLQNPTNRREIIADQSLSKLLAYDGKKDAKPLTYPRIQSLMKPHFVSA